MDENRIEDLEWGVEEAQAMYGKLRIYDNACEVADRIWDLVAAWDAFPKDTLGKQVVRSVDSIGANLAEGSGRGTNAELLRYSRIARGSLCETQHWINRSARRNLLPTESAQALSADLTSLLKQINAFISKMSEKS